jgi:hypothetical protein
LLARSVAENGTRLKPGWADPSRLTDLDDHRSVARPDGRCPTACRLLLACVRERRGALKTCQTLEVSATKIQDRCDSSAPVSPSFSSPIVPAGDEDESLTPTALPAARVRGRRSRRRPGQTDLRERKQPGAKFGRAAACVTFTIVHRRTPSPNGVSTPLSQSCHIHSVLLSIAATVDRGLAAPPVSFCSLVFTATRAGGSTVGERTSQT